MSQGPKATAKAGTFRPNDSLSVFVNVEIPALGKREQLHFALRTGRNSDVLDGVRELVCGICSEWQGAVGPEMEKAEQQLKKLGQDAAAEVETWRTKVNMADEWKKKVDNASAAMNKMREDYFKELMHLREQVYRQDKSKQAGIEFHPTYAEFFDPTEYTMDMEVRGLTRLKAAMLEQEYEIRLGEVEVKHMARIRDLKEQVFVARFMQQKKDKLIQKIKAEFNLSSSKLQEMMESAKVNEEKLKAKIQEQMNRAEEIALKAYEEAKAKEKALQEELQKRLAEQNQPTSMVPKARRQTGMLDPKVVEALQATERKPGDLVQGIEYPDFSDCSDDDSDRESSLQGSAASREGPRKPPSKQGRALVRVVELLPGFSMAPRMTRAKQPQTPARAIELLPGVAVLPHGVAESHAEARGSNCQAEAVASVGVQTLIDSGTLTTALNYLDREGPKGDKGEPFHEESRWRAAAISSISSARPRSRSRASSTAHVAPALAEDTDAHLDSQGSNACSPLASRAGSRASSRTSSRKSSRERPAAAALAQALRPEGPAPARSRPAELSPEVQAILRDLHAGTDERSVREAVLKLTSVVFPPKVDAETQVESSWADALPPKLQGMLSRPGSKDSVISASSSAGNMEMLLSAVTSTQLRERIRAAWEGARATLLEAVQDCRAMDEGPEQTALEHVLQWLERGPGAVRGSDPGGARKREGSHSGVADVHKLRAPSKQPSEEAGSVVYFNACVEDEAEQAASRGWGGPGPRMARTRSSSVVGRAAKSRPAATQPPEGQQDYGWCVGPRSGPSGAPSPEPRVERCVSPKLPKAAKGAPRPESPKQPRTARERRSNESLLSTERIEQYLTSELVAEVTQQQSSQTACAERPDQLPALAPNRGSPMAAAAATAKPSAASHMPPPTQRAPPAASLRMPAAQRVDLVTPPPAARHLMPGTQRADLITPPPPAPNDDEEEELKPGWSGLLPPVGFRSHRPTEEISAALEPARGEPVGTPNGDVKSPPGKRPANMPTRQFSKKQSSQVHVTAHELDAEPAPSAIHRKKPALLRGDSKVASDASSAIGGDDSSRSVSNCSCASVPTSNRNEQKGPQHRSDSKASQPNRGGVDNKTLPMASPKKASQVLQLPGDAGVCLVTEKGAQSARGRPLSGVGARPSVSSVPTDSRPSVTSTSAAFPTSGRRKSEPDVLRPGSVCGMTCTSPPRRKTDLDLPQVTESAKGPKSSARSACASANEAKV